MEKILRITLEIIRLLTGQEDVVLKKFGDHIIIEPSPRSPKTDDKWRILELTTQMIELLAGERLADTARDACKDVVQEDQRAVCSSLVDKPDVTSRFPKSSPEDVMSEEQQKYSGDITVRLGSCDKGNLQDGDEDKSTDYPLACVKIEPDTNNEDHICEVYGMEELSSLNIKEESFSGDEGAVVSSPEDNSQYNTISIKEESFSGEETEKNTKNMKEESSSGGDEILRDTDIYSPPSHIKIKSDSCEQEHQRDMDVGVRLAHTLSTSIHKKPGRKLNECQMFEPNTDGMYCCRDCRKCSPTTSRLIKHQGVQKVKPIPCPQSGKNVSCNFALARLQTGPKEEKPFACCECGKCVSSKPALVAHQRVHKGEKLFVCSDCGQQFLFKSHLVRHQKKHTGEEPFSCLECGKSYSSQAAIVIHQRLHTGNALYSCLECGKGFVQKNHLQQHLNIHTGEKPYACPECGKRFIQKSNLKQHLSVHLPKKKEIFSCSECGKCYKRRADFRWHMLIHLGEK